jgi:ATP-binding cassette subfamily F protein 3
VLDKGTAQVIHGNYDTYELLRAAQEAAKREANPVRKGGGASELPRARSVPKSAKPKRKFPFRKVADLEADIATTEARVKQAEELLASPDLYRDAVRLKETMRDFEESKAKLHRLYEHWEEAVELN